VSKGPKHVVYLLTPYTLIKFCCVLTYPPYINCDTVVEGTQPNATGYVRVYCLFIFLF